MRCTATSAIALFLLIGAASARAQEQIAVRNIGHQPIALDVTVVGVNKSAGVIRVALCPALADFPKCGAKAVRTAALRIERGQAHVTLNGLAPGTYAISVFHDANENGKLDTFAGIPKEGYGSSNNPSFRPRAPRFTECEIVLTASQRTAIRLRYLL